MGFSTKKTKTRSTVTPTNPSWVEPQLNSLATRVTDLSKMDPFAFVAPANPLQTRAADAASRLAPDNKSYGDALGLFQGLMNTGAQHVEAATGSATSLLPKLSDYMSPYLRDIVDTSLADYDFGAGQTRAQNALARANDDAFGGSSGALQTALSEDALTRGRAALAAKLRDQGFQAGANLSNLDAERAQQMDMTNLSAINQARQFNAEQVEAALARQQAAARDLASTAGAQNQTALADINAQAEIGDAMRQIAQQQAQAPLSSLASLAGAYRDLPLSLLQGQVTNSTTKETDSMLGALGQMVSIATGLQSFLPKH